MSRRGIFGFVVVGLVFGCGSGGGGGAFDGGAGFGGSEFGGAGGVAGNEGDAAADAGGGGSLGHTVSGLVQIVNPGEGSTTSVILASASFNPDVPALDPPAGPKAQDVVGAWSIPNVPDGSYRVLVGYENDFLVEDPEHASGQPLIIDVSGQDVSLAEALNVTGSLDVVSPDNGNVVSGSPTFVWKDDSGEDHYELRVYDAQGGVVWQELAVPASSGAANVELSYGGPPLVSGQTYRFAATSFKAGGIPVSRTEDLRGVFVYE